MASETSFQINRDTLDFSLPEALIAQEALAERDQARLMVLDRRANTIGHFHFCDLPSLLNNGDVLVLNRTKVSRTKVYGKKFTGGKVEVLFVSGTDDPFVWKALVRPSVREGTEFVLGSGVRASVEKREENGIHWVRTSGTTPAELVAKDGVVPLPPYIKRSPVDPRRSMDEENYQTVYASEPGSIAAPTAGLHFSNALLSALEKKGVERLDLLLQVGWGTFKPVLGTIHTHAMLPEAYDLAPAVYDRLVQARQSGRRLIAVGTTTTRVLESLSPNQNGTRSTLRGETALFIKPGFQFKWLCGLITNFHVPRSTPLSLAAAFCGFELLERAYHEAIERKYRFYSYGDGMLIL